MKPPLVATALACSLLLGCVSRPFPDPPPFAAGAPPAEVPARFAARLAPQFEQVNAIVFRFRLRELTTLGMAAVDVPNRSFAVTCMTPLGVKLFDLVCTQGQVEGRFVHPELAKRGGDLAEVAGDDLLHAYFDWQPPAGTPHRLAGERLVFVAADPTGKTEYRYAWRDGRLAEKIRFEEGRRQWTIEYREYAEGGDGLTPTGMVITNHRHKYRLIVSTRQETR